VAKIVLSRPAKPAPKATSDRAQAESLADRLRRASGSKRPERPQLAAKLRNLSEHEKRRARGETFEEDPTRLWCPERLLIEGGAGQ
jgi:hypothetical protein